MEGVIATFHLRRSKTIARYDQEGQHCSDSKLPFLQKDKKAKSVSTLFPVSAFHGETRSNSCCEKYQQIWCLSTVNLSGTEVPEDTLKKLHRFQLSALQKKPMH